MDVFNDYTSNNDDFPKPIYYYIRLSKKLLLSYDVSNVR